MKGLSGYTSREEKSFTPAAAARNRHGRGPANTVSRQTGM